MNHLPVQATTKDRWLRRDQVMQRLNIGKSEFYRLVSAGHFVCFQVGKRGLRIQESSLEAYIQRRISVFELENGK